jgi:DNA-binding response OmpR family regulator
MVSGNLNKTVLIMEDELDMRFYLSSMVKSLGFEATIAPNGDKGMDYLKKALPNLIILDVMMPEKGGALVYQELKLSDQYEKVPLIVFSGVNRQSFEHYVKMLNVNLKKKIPLPEYYIEKTADPDYLMKVIKTAIQ